MKTLDYDGNEDDMLTENIIYEDLYKIFYSILYSYEVGDMYTGNYRLRIFNNETTVYEYTLESMELLKEFFFPEFNFPEFFKILPYLTMFFFQPQYLLNDWGEESFVFWTFRRKNVAKFYHWRNKVVLAVEPFVLAIELALSVIQMPLLHNENISSGYIYTNNDLVAWNVTLSDDFSQVDPLYRLARNILDTLLPYWEEKYGRFFEE